MQPEVQCCISVDIDAVAGWLGSYGGEDSTSDISRGTSTSMAHQSQHGESLSSNVDWLTITQGLFAGTIGVRRLLKMFERYNIKTTWFIPGHSLETFPEECRMIADAGHEIGLHGYSHENPIAMTLEQQTAIMDKVWGAIRRDEPSLPAMSLTPLPTQCYNLITEFQHGKPPRGIVAPW
jgi:hypothetical protein